MHQNKDIRILDLLHNVPLSCNLKMKYLRIIAIYSYIKHRPMSEPITWKRVK